MKLTLPLSVGLVSIGLLAMAQPADAQGIVYTNQACDCSAAHIVSYDKTTGAVIHTYSGVEGNGRGVVVVGNTLYYTMVGDAHIYELDVTTGLPIGSILTSVGSMSTIGWDGSQFWTSDYSGSNEAYRIDLSGTTTTTIHLTNAGGNSDGMEYFNGKLIANRGDAAGPYDVYDLSGNVLQAAFITPTFAPTGIAFDGTNFLVSDLRGQGFGVFSGSTGSYLSYVSYADHNSNIEDLSVDYSQRIDTGGGNVVPEPSSMLLLASGLVAAVGARRRSRRRQTPS
jgi:hypothetical protein